jgi:hypothetical protein
VLSSNKRRPLRLDEIFRPDAACLYTLFTISQNRKVSSNPKEEDPELFSDEPLPYLSLYLATVAAVVASFAEDSKHVSIRPGLGPYLQLIAQHGLDLLVQSLGPRWK